jgi:hypothetical protein
MYSCMLCICMYVCMFVHIHEHTFTHGYIHGLGSSPVHSHKYIHIHRCIVQGSGEKGRIRVLLVDERELLMKPVNLAATGVYLNLAATRVSVILVAACVFVNLAATGVYLNLAATRVSVILVAACVFVNLAATGLYVGI